MGNDCGLKTEKQTTMQAIEAKHMTARKTFQGAWEISALVGSYLVTRQYFGYSKREAIAAFKGETRT